MRESFHNTQIAQTRCGNRLRAVRDDAKNNGIVLSRGEGILHKQPVTRAEVAAGFPKNITFVP